MTNDSPLQALLVTISVALVCSLLVSGTVVGLKTLRSVYKDVQRNRVIIDVAGIVEDSGQLSEQEVGEVFGRLEARVVELDSGRVADGIDPRTFDQRKAAAAADLSVPIPAEENVAGLGRRAKYATVYFAKRDDVTERLILPIHGQGMWSTIYGYIALNADLNTIADIRFYEQGETPGLGDQILDPAWQAGWRNKSVFDRSGAVKFRVAAGAVDRSGPESSYQVDGLSGATITGDAVTNMVRYWLGSHGFGPFLQRMNRTGVDSVTSNPFLYVRLLGAGTE